MSESIQRKKFNEVFLRNPDGSLTPKITLRIGGVTFGPGVRFGPGVKFSGIDFFDYLGHDIAVVDVNGILEIKGFYNL